jgi:hypothetical protein
VVGKYSVISWLPDTISIKELDDRAVKTTVASERQPCHLQGRDGSPSRPLLSWKRPIVFEMWYQL